MTNTLDEIKAITLFMRSQGVQSFTLGDLHVEFTTQTQPSAVVTPNDTPPGLVSHEDTAPPLDDNTCETCGGQCDHHGNCYTGDTNHSGSCPF